MNDRAKAIAIDIACWARADSLVQLPIDRLRKAVEEDAKESGHLLSVGYMTGGSDCYLLVCADADDKKAKRLRKLYPRTTELLVELLWT